MKNNSDQPQEENDPRVLLERKYAHRLHLVGKVIERDGKYYQQFIDGELEITSERIDKMKSTLAYLTRLIRNEQERYKRNQENWKTLEDLPKDLDMFSEVDLFVEDLDTSFAQLIGEEGITDTWPKLRLIAGKLLTEADEMQYDYSPHSTQLREYRKAKLQGLRTRWEDMYQLASKQEEKADILTISDKNEEPRLFSEMLANNYSEADFSNLLIYLRMKDKNGQTIWPSKKKSGLFGVIDALEYKGYIVEASQKEKMSSLCTYLGLSQGRVKNGYSNIQNTIRAKALSFINQPVKPIKRNN